MSSSQAVSSTNLNQVTTFHLEHDLTLEGAKQEARLSGFQKVPLSMHLY